MSDQGIVLSSVRLCNDQKGNLQILLLGAGPFPVLVWTVPRLLVDELLVGEPGESGAIVQCDAETLAVGLYFPPGSDPARFRPYIDPRGARPVIEEPREQAAAE
jgi:hypothetical protein